MKLTTTFAVFALVMAPGIALAQNTIREGAAGGATAGGAVGGPVGAAVGGTVGAVVGTAAAIPDAVVGSVTRANVPSVVVRERVVVGEPLPRYVQLRPVPRHTGYRYAIVNNQRVIVEPRTRKVIRIIQ